MSASQSPNTPLVKPGNGHPVADNALRMLFGARNEESNLKDLERNARALRLQARRGPITPPEPLCAHCPRQRSEEDYGWALKQAGDPTQLAVALFFWPSSFGCDNPMQQANQWLLQAEGLPQGDGRKAELLTLAIREYDDAKADAWISFAVSTARQMLETDPDLTETRRQVGEAVRRVAERVVADFGDTIEASEIELLNAIDECTRLPEIQGASRAAEAVIAKQLEQIDRYLEHAYKLLGEANHWKTAGLSAIEIQRLVSGCQQARGAFALLARRPALLRAMPADRLKHLSTVSVALALQIGSELSHWDSARRLSEGIKPKDIDSEVGSELAPVLRVASRAIPLLALAFQGADVSSGFHSLRSEFPNAPHVVENFRQRALDLNGGRGATKPSQGATQRAPATQGGAGCLLTMVALVALGIWGNSCNDSAKPRPTASTETYRVPRHLASDLRAEQAAIEEHRRNVQANFDRIDSLKRQLDLEAGYLDRSSSFAVSQHNRRASEYNSELSAARAAQDSLNARVDTYNARLRQKSR